MYFNPKDLNHFKYSKLQELEIRKCYLNDDFYDFIQNQNNLKVLKIHFHSEKDSLDKLKNLHLKIEDLRIEFSCEIKQECIENLNSLKSLKKLSIFSHVNWFFKFVEITQFKIA